jgi:hypothetical protein
VELKNKGTLVADSIPGHEQDTSRLGDMDAASGFIHLHHLEVH